MLDVPHTINGLVIEQRDQCVGWEPGFVMNCGAKFSLELFQKRWRRNKTTRAVSCQWDDHCIDDVSGNLSRDALCSQHIECALH